MSEEPWYNDGLKFRCTGCGTCCTGAPGAVWVTDDEIRRIAEHTGKTVGEVRLFHTRLVVGRTSLTEYANGDCTFFDGATRRCTIYEARPTQCRTWPFWPGYVETPEAWDSVRKDCPGAGRGDFVPLDEITRQLQA